MSPPVVTHARENLLAVAAANDAINVMSKPSVSETAHRSGAEEIR